jgi:hypothetical protein
MTLAAAHRRLAYLLAPALGLFLYWRVPLIWFQNDDFAWLSLGRDLHENGLLHALFAPFAQGTVRVFGDRLYFLALSQAFGLHALPFHLVQLATWIAALILVSLIGEKLTASRAAGVAAALLWAANANAVSSVAWPSAFNQVLCAVCLLAAFYSRLRGWSALEWTFYLAGFGALEIAVMYPALVWIYALAADRRQLRNALWLFLPAAVFTALHFWLIPKSSTGSYALSLDSRLPSTIANYFSWTLEPAGSALRSHAEQLRAPELLLGMILGLTLSWFTLRCLVRRESLAGFFAAWFLVLLAPVLLLPDHLTPYYLTLPTIGLAWLAGWGIARAWATGERARLASLALASVYVTVSAAGIQAQTRWFQTRSNRMHEVVEAVAAEAAAHPGAAIALQGVDDELYQTGFEDHPFRLVGADHVWRVPQDARVNPGGDIYSLDISGSGTRTLP